MPIKIPTGLPAAAHLEAEGVFVMQDMRAQTQDIRPLRVLLLNLMPEKLKTELQIARLLGSSPLQVELTLLAPASYTPSTTPAEHLLAYYTTFDAIAGQTFDALIVTGAPVEHMAFEDVAYWDELCRIFDWAQTHVFAHLYLCWGAQAALHWAYGVPKHVLPNKLFGVLPYRTMAGGHPLLRGFDDEYGMPVSRHTETRLADVEGIAGVHVLAASDTYGVGLLADRCFRKIFMLNHLEYDAHTLADEYHRDVKAGKPIDMPVGYFPHDNAALPPMNLWRAHAHLFFQNWLNDVYQRTPYVLADIPRVVAEVEGA